MMDVIVGLGVEGVSDRRGDEVGVGVEFRGVIVGCVVEHEGFAVVSRTAVLCWFGCCGLRVLVVLLFFFFFKAESAFLIANAKEFLNADFEAGHRAISLVLL